jgi:hypothetical protein
MTDMSWDHGGKKQRHCQKTRAFSSEVDTGSREENALNQKIRARL